MQNPNRPPRAGLTPEQERRRAEWQQYAAEQQAERQAAAAARRRAEAEYARRLEAERRAERAEARRFFGDCFQLYLIVLVLLLLIIGGVFLFTLHKTDRPETPAKIAYTVGGKWDEAGKVIEKPIAAYTLDYADAVPSEVAYLPMTPLAELAGLRVTGSPEIQKFATPLGEYVRFTAGSTTAEVNGEPYVLDGPARLLKQQGSEVLWVPADFITAWMEGVTVTYDDEAAAYAIALDEATPTAFSLKGGAPLAPIDEKIVFGNTPAIEFKADLAAYERYMNPEDRDAYLTLINVDNKLAADYVPPDLVNIASTRKDGRNTQQMREYAAKALEAMVLEMREYNINNVTVTSGYRTYAYQSQLFEQRVAMYPSLSREEAEQKASTVVTYPGASEHQSGLCVDMHNLSSADVKFATTAAFAWLEENAHKFGFIIRYPENKIEQTGVSYEPWHYRFVGRYHATQIYMSGVCLEEYVAGLMK